MLVQDAGRSQTNRMSCATGRSASLSKAHEFGTIDHSTLQLTAQLNMGETRAIEIAATYDLLPLKTCNA